MQTGTSPDLIATSGENLKIYEINNNQEVKMRLNLKNVRIVCFRKISFVRLWPRSIGTHKK